MKKRTAASALPWLIACLHASTWADPMRPLIPPANAASAASAASTPQAERTATAREGDAPREPERLVAIRQDSASRWQALFGERWVAVGDKLERYTVTAIDANAVQLAEGRQRRTLHLLPPLLRPGPTAAASASAVHAARTGTDVAQARLPTPTQPRAPGVLSP